MNTKCIECGNFFRKDSIVLGDVVICPICEAQYKVAVAENGKLFLDRFVFSGNDAGEL